MHRHRAGGREITIPAIPIDYVQLNDRDDQLQAMTGAPILVGKCDRDRWIGAAMVSTKGADEYAIAELKNDVSWQWLRRGSREVGQRAGCPSPEGVNSDSIEVVRCDCQDRGECPVRLAKERLGKEHWEGCERWCQDEFGLSRRAFRTGVHRRTSVLALTCEVLCCDGEQMLERSR